MSKTTSTLTSSELNESTCRQRSATEELEGLIRVLTATGASEKRLSVLRAELAKLRAADS
jgi:hypothetical protein